MNDISKILGNELIQNMFIKDSLKLSEINIIMRLLVSWNIPFEIEFSEASRSEASFIVLRIILSPTTAIEQLFSLEAGITEF